MNEDIQSVAQKHQLIVDNNGKKSWVDNRKYPIRNELGDIIGLFGIARVISDSDDNKYITIIKVPYEF